ncbi:MAG: dihydroorotate dehydrogenase-like protein [Armatimonadetes bacterium]|nr:dihydroorotate dehydrogenase-like protein [Armatimonadota bacterium]
MADISTSYMGILFKSPVIVGACSISHKIDNIKKAEEAGAGAIVIHSLFQEQIEYERLELDEELSLGADIYAESLTYLPHMEHSGAREHVMWVEQARKEVSFPMIGSLNATSVGEWVGYAKLLEDAGCDALELNLYSVETHPEVTCTDIESRSLEVVADVKSVVKIPVAVKLSPFYTSTAHFVSKVVEAGADGVVLFNRFYQPNIDPEKEALDIRLDLSRPEDNRLPLRWIAILSGIIDTDFVAGTGVYGGLDVVRQILAGARATQSVSALLSHGIAHVAVMNEELEAWMERKGYKSIEEFRGKLSKEGVSGKGFPETTEGDPRAFERAQYISALLQHK